MTLSLVGVAGLLLGLVAWKFAFIQKTSGRAAVFIAAYVLHIAASAGYYFWAQSNPADTSIYYNDIYDFYGAGFGFGTRFVVYFVQISRELFGGSYFDYFMLFQAFGFWGIALLMRIFEEICIDLQVDQPPITYAFVFLPGIHWWTSMIGKDGPLFLSISLAVWSAMRLRNRFVGFSIAILIMTFFRPHIALVTCIALALATMFGRHVRFTSKIMLVLVALIGASIIAGTVRSTFGVDVTNADSLSNFYAATSEMATSVGGGTAVVGASFPERLLSLLFRPFYFDAGGTFAYIASLENTFILIALVTVFWNFSISRRLTREVFFLRFSAVFSVLLTFFLALVYYNVGLGLRQKMMIMPTFLTFVTAVIAVRLAEARRRNLIGSSSADVRLRGQPV